MRYKKKESIIEAMQYRGDIKLLLDFGVTIVGKNDAGKFSCSIKTPSGHKNCQLRDYVLKDAEGHFSVLPPDIFERSYELCSLSSPS